MFVKFQNNANKKLINSFLKYQFSISFSQITSGRFTIFSYIIEVILYTQLLFIIISEVSIVCVDFDYKCTIMNTFF